MSNFNITDEQLLNIMNNKILDNEMELDSFTGGYVQRLLKATKVVLFFGYKAKSKHPVSLSFDIEDNVSDIWFKAIGYKLSTIRDNNKSSGIEELIALSSKNILEKKENKKENRIEGNSVPPREGTGVTKQTMIGKYIDSRNGQHTDNEIAIIKDFIKYKASIKSTFKTIRPLTAYWSTLLELHKLGYDVKTCISTMKEKEWKTLEVGYIHKDTKQEVEKEWAE